MNAQRKIPERPKTRQIDISSRMTDENDKRRWHYIDLEQFEFDIRQQELEKYVAQRRMERKTRAWKREAKCDLFKLTLIPRIVGVCILALTVFSWMLLKGLGGPVDGPYMLITIPLGLLLIIMPGWNKPQK